ncbi:hypothetical protein Vadar_010023 [Vaccinium darrowii]|uniref:Uncharacterized protein n=1 Tax=Vaccinium darrowii TaxID=229202 RepID=A0ACB7YCS1_9ERIC|nr:hypothetical protein Vadar_010023 [Vaccinium darrowii]
MKRRPGMSSPIDIKPLDSQAYREPWIRNEVATAKAKHILKSRLKVQKNSLAEKLVAGENGNDGLVAEFDPSSVCLAKMVRNFIEESGSNRSSNCFQGNSNDSFYDEFDMCSGLGSPADSLRTLKSLIPCASLAEKNLLADTWKIVEKNKTRVRKDNLSKIVTAGLLLLGHDASICKSRWERSPSIPAGEYKYIDVIVEGGERLFIDINFRSQFEIARPTGGYKLILQSLPHIFVGRADRLDNIVSIVSEAARQSLKSRGMDIPPWRKTKYVRSKWLSPHSRTTAAAAVQEEESLSGYLKLIFSEETSPWEEIGAVGSANWSPVENSGEEKKYTWKPPAIEQKSCETGTKLTLSGSSKIFDGSFSNCGDKRIIVLTTNHSHMDSEICRELRMIPEFAVHDLLSKIDALFNLRHNNERIFVFTTNHRDQHDAASLLPVGMDIYIHKSSEKENTGEAYNSTKRNSLQDFDATKNKAVKLFTQRGSDCSYSMELKQPPTFMELEKDPENEGLISDLLSFLTLSSLFAIICLYLPFNSEQIIVLTINLNHRDRFLVSNSEKESTRETSKSLCMTGSVLSPDDTSTISLANFIVDALDYRADLVRSYQSPIMFALENKDTREGLNRECLSKSVLSDDGSTKRELSPGRMSLAFSELTREDSDGFSDFVDSDLDDFDDLDNKAGMLPNSKDEFVDGLSPNCEYEWITVSTTNHRNPHDAALLPLVNMDTDIHMASPQPIAFPDGGEIVQLESLEQKSLVDFDATNNRAYQSNVLVSSQKKHMIGAYKGQWKKDMGDGLNEESLTKSVLGLDDLTEQNSVDLRKGRGRLHSMELERLVTFAELGMDPENEGIVSDLMRMLPNLKNELTGSYLLEFADGLLSSCGDEQIIVFTTNRRDLHDAALRHPLNDVMYIHKSSPQPVALPDEGGIMDKGEIVQLNLFEQRPLVEFDATNNIAHLLKAHESGPYVFISEKEDITEKKETREGLGRECLTECVFCLDDSTKHKASLDFYATENKAHMIRAYQSGPVVSLSENKSRGEVLKRDCITKSIHRLEDLQQLCGGRREAAAKRFDEEVLQRLQSHQTRHN